MNSAKQNSNSNLKKIYIDKTSGNFSNRYILNKLKLELPKRTPRKIIKNAGNFTNIVFKKYLLGNDIILPFNSIVNQFDDYSDSNRPFYTFSNYGNFKQLNSMSPMRTENRAVNKNISNFKLSCNKNITNKGRHSQKRIAFGSNKNGLSIYDSIEVKNCSYKHLNSKFKRRNISRKIDSFSNLKKDLTNSKTPKLNLSKKNKKCKSFNLKIHKIFKGENKNILSENNKNEGYESKKEIATYNIAKKLIDNPNSFVYLMFNKIKGHKFDEEGNPLKLDLKKRFNEYKKDLDKLEQKARYELFNLKKQRVIGNEIAMKGRINSTNTFFTLGFGGY